MKVWLDTNPPPDGWIWVRTPKEAAGLIETGEVKEISIAYHLDFCIFTGLDFLVWLKQKVFYEGFSPPPKIHIHNTSLATRKKMRATVEKIKRLTQSA